LAQINQWKLLNPDSAKFGESPIPVDTHQKILIIQLRQLGDILLTTPVIKALRDAFPAATIDFLSHKMGDLVLGDNPHLNTHLVHDERFSLKDHLNLIRTLREPRYDLLIDYMNNPRSAFLSWISRAKKRVSFESIRRLAYTDTLKIQRGQRYIVEEKLEFLRELGIPAISCGLTLPWFEHDLNPTLELLGQNPEIAGRHYRIVLSPTHRRPIRRWPGKRYVDLADALTKDWNAAVIWLWGPGEFDFVKGLADSCQEKSFLAPPITFKEMAALIANCDFFVGNSNGPSHVAIATDTVSLQLHGHTFLTSWCPLTEKHQGIQSPEYGIQELPSLETIGFATVRNKVDSMRAVVGRYRGFYPRRWDERPQKA
jgi:heptosyltransferase III